jgi:hypothetical protein
MLCSDLCSTVQEEQRFGGKQRESRSAHHRFCLYSSDRHTLSLRWGNTNQTASTLGLARWCRPNPNLSSSVNKNWRFVSYSVATNIICVIVPTCSQTMCWWSVLKKLSYRNMRRSSLRAVKWNSGHCVGTGSLPSEAWSSKYERTTPHTHNVHVGLNKN